MDGNAKAKFSTIAEAVEAVDFEVSRAGPRTNASARMEAPWRRLACPSDRATRLAGERLRTAVPTTMGALVLLEAWARVLPQRSK
jgi:hypothetical protein